MYDQIKKDLLEAMKNKEKDRLEVIRMLKSALQLEEISLGGNGAGLTDDQVLAVIKREVKKRNSSIEEYTKYNKMEMVESLKKEVEILSVYLPAPLSDDELNKIIDETIAEVGATEIKQMGIVIKSVSAKVGTRADMGAVSKIVKEKLSA